MVNHFHILITEKGDGGQLFCFDGNKVRTLLLATANKLLIKNGLHRFTEAYSN